MTGKPVVPVVCVETGRLYPSIAEAARDTGVARAAISSVSRSGGTAGGWHWQRAAGRTTPLPTSREKVLLFLRAVTGPDGASVLTYRDIARTLGIGEKTARDAVTRLVRNGVVERTLCTTPSGTVVGNRFRVVE